MTEPWYFWAGFGLIISALLAVDLGVFHRKSHEVGFKEALGWTIVWMTLAGLFGGWVWQARGPERGLEFFTGYLIELSLSADNVFIFALIFGYFSVPKRYQHKVLFWGVLSAVVLRFAMIWVGAALLERFEWLIYIFGGFLLFTGLKLLWNQSAEAHPESNFVVRLFRKVVPTTHDYDGSKFLTRKNGRWLATPLMVVLVCVEASDLIFALDSIPAIFAVTRDPFIVFTSNIFAILGLRSLYFLLAGIMDKFHYLRSGLGIILAFVGVKMLLTHTEYKINSGAALAVVGVVLAGSIAASLIWPPRGELKERSKPAPGEA